MLFCHFHNIIWILEFVNEWYIATPWIDYKNLVICRFAWDRIIKIFIVINKWMLIYVSKDQNHNIRKTPNWFLICIYRALHPLLKDQYNTDSEESRRMRVLRGNQRIRNQSMEQIDRATSMRTSPFVVVVVVVVVGNCKRSWRICCSIDLRP